MSAPIALLAAESATRRWYRLDERQLGLTFRPDTPFDIWESETLNLMTLARGIQWLVGDALVWGEEHYGQDATQVLDPYHYSEESVSRMARTARAIPAHRRRPTVPFAIHADVAALPLSEQETLLDYAADHGARRDEIRVMVRATKQKLARQAAAALPAPQLLIDGMTLAVSDARDLPLSDETVDLLVTSPPYALDKPYGVAGDVDGDHWPMFTYDWLTEALRVTKPSGRLALNVPLDTSEPDCRPTYAQAVAAALAAGWVYRSTIAWQDGATTKGQLALGSVDSAARPHHVSALELIGLFSKGTWAPSSLGRDDITAEQFQEAGRGPWLFPGESHPWEGHPAPFPLELPRRLIRYLSRVGDVICDPFLGSGTTMIAAYQSGRCCYGYDLDPDAIASSGRRLALASRRAP